MSRRTPSIRDAAKLHHAGADQILRFRAAERHLHWAIAIPFKVCYLTALILVLVYNPHPTRPLRELVSWTHRLSGVCLAVLPGLTIAWHWRDFRIHLYNVRQGWTWRLDDLRWLLLLGPATLDPRISLPHQGKFNAGEKINFVAVMTTYPLYVITGLLIWFSSLRYVPWLVHFSMAVMATPLVLGHIFMATVNPDTRVGLRGMITGFVDRSWAKHHYRLWYDEHFGKKAATDGAAVAGDRRPAPAPLQFPVRHWVVPAVPVSRVRSVISTPMPVARPAASAAVDEPPPVAAPRDPDRLLQIIELENARAAASGVAGAARAS